MMNFNTNQTRHFYVAGAINANVAKDRNAADNAAASNLDIAIVATATGELAFAYKNNEGLITRSDTFDPKKIVSLKKTTAAQLAKPLMMAEVSADSNVIDFGSSSSFIGKTFNLMITLHGLYDYDDDNCVTCVASVLGDATNLATQKDFTKALAVAVAKCLPKNDPKYPMLQVFYNGIEVTSKTKVADLSGNVTVLKLVQAPQKYVRGKLSGEPVNFSLYGKVRMSNVSDIDFLTEGSHELKPSDVTGHISISGAYALADLEYFALGERGDVYRGMNYPNDYEQNYAIALNGTYSVLTVEYYWAGGAENVQKSPRLIQVAAPETVSDDIVSALYATIEAAINGGGSGSGSGA